MHTILLRILIERRTRQGSTPLPADKVAETAVEALLAGTRGRLRGFNVEGYRWMAADGSAPTVALTSLVEGWDRDLERDVKAVLADLCLRLDQEAIAVSISPAESFVVTRAGEAAPL